MNSLLGGVVSFQDKVRRWVKPAIVFSVIMAAFAVIQVGFAFREGKLILLGTLVVCFSVFWLTNGEGRTPQAFMRWFWEDGPKENQLQKTLWFCSILLAGTLVSLATFHLVGMACAFIKS